MPSKLVIPHEVRRYSVSNVIASARIESIAPTKRLEQNLADYVAGKKTIVQLIEETKKCFDIHRLK